ncbi:MAG: YdjY domain-containing protein [Planctomycetota bacterium]
MIDVISSARHRTDGLFWLLSWVPVLTLVQVAPAASDQPNDGPSPKSAPTSIKDFAPGVHIDWANRAVEIDARVVLRSGPLELLACSPKTREHESILVVDARPLHVYQALGLIGLAPGSPSRFDEASRKSIPPSGEPTVVEVRFRLAGGEQTVPAEKWLLDVKTKQSPESLNWVFAGSKTLEDGRFLADLDGTVVCVVDFDSALVAVGETHSAENDLLWANANAQTIPPVGTPCMLIFRAKAPAALVIDVRPDGSFRLGDEAADANSIAQRIAATMPGQAERLILRGGAAVSDEQFRAAVMALEAAGLKDRKIEINRPPPSSELPSPPAPVEKP